jgi:hypothetical protein
MVGLFFLVARLCRAPAAGVELRKDVPNPQIAAGLWYCGKAEFIVQCCFWQRISGRNKGKSAKFREQMARFAHLSSGE